MNKLCFLLLLVPFMACQHQPNKAPESTNKETPTHLSSMDTITHLSRIKIANDEGRVQIIGHRKFENQQLTESTFLIELLDFPQYPLTFQVDQQTLTAAIPDFYLADSTQGEYLQQSKIKDIRYHGLRSNTLYFEFELENYPLQKRVLGRFNSFYRTKKKGILYGWMLDEIEPLK